MSVPNDSHIVYDLYETGNYDLHTEEGQGRFVDDAVTALHAHDMRWGHLKKNPGQSNIHGHAEDATLYLADTGLSSAVDFIAGAGGANPSPTWQVDIPRYSPSDWYAPEDHPPLDGETPGTPPPTLQPYPDEPTWWSWFTLEVKQRYPGGQLNDEAFRWFTRTAYDIAAGLTKEESAAKHLAELDAAVGQ